MEFHWIQLKEKTMITVFLCLFISTPGQVKAKVIICEITFHHSRLLKATNIHSWPSVFSFTLLSYRINLTAAIIHLPNVTVATMCFLPDCYLSSLIIKLDSRLILLSDCLASLNWTWFGWIWFALSKSCFWLSMLAKHSSSGPNQP